MCHGIFRNLSSPCSVITNKSIVTETNGLTHNSEQALQSLNMVLVGQVSVTQKLAARLIKFLSPEGNLSPEE